MDRRGRVMAAPLSARFKRNGPLAGPLRFSFPPRVRPSRHRLRHAPRQCHREPRGGLGRDRAVPAFILGFAATGESRACWRDASEPAPAHTCPSSMLMHEAQNGSRFLATRPLARDDSVYTFSGDPDDANGMTGR